MVIQYVKDDWTWRFPQKVKNNRYRGASKHAYVFWCFLYYVLKDALILYFYFVFRFFKFVFWDIWNWLFKTDKRQWLANLYEQYTPVSYKETENINEGMPNSYTNINDLWKYGDEFAWKKALTHYYELIPAYNMSLEKELESISPEEIERMTAKEFYYFLYNKYFVWKYTQKNRLATTRRHLEKYIKENRLYELEKIKEGLFSADLDDVEQSLSIATKIRGLGPAGASGLLSILFPHYFGTVDQFVVKALSQIEDLSEQNAITHMKPEALTISDACVITAIMRNKARLLNAAFQVTDWTPRKIDMILWAMGR